MPVKFVTVWPWHYDEPALYIMQSQCYNSSELLELIEPHSSFRFQYRLLTMTTYFEIAVYATVSSDGGLELKIRKEANLLLSK